MIRQLLPAPAVLESPADLESYYQLGDDPHLRVNFVASLDGVIEVDGRSGGLGGPADRAAFMAMRAASDVILVGAGTARAENYGAVRLDDESRTRRISRGQSALPPIAVLTSTADLDATSRLFEAGSQVLVLTTEQAAASHPELSARAEMITCGVAQVDLPAALDHLRSRRLSRVLCEGGPALATSLVAGGLVDEWCLTLAPVLVGGGRRLVSSPLGGERMTLTGLLEAEGMLLARYTGAGQR